MLQVNLKPYASDALEDAMRLAETKALNSYSWSDCLNHMNYVWSDVYNRIAQMDEGYYSKTVKLTSRLTKLPPFVKNTIKVYNSPEIVGANRKVFRESGLNDLQSMGTYHISGFDLYCPSAERRTVWLNYIPMAPMLFFTHHNRDPKIYDTFDKVVNLNYGMYDIVLTMGNGVILGVKLVHKNMQLNIQQDITELLTVEDWELIYVSAAFPYIFVSYRNKYTDEYKSGFFNNILTDAEFIDYNPFAYTGLPSNVEYLKVGWNDKTGMGVVVQDHSDGKIKELGWTPDTLLVYPAPEMYRLLVARLADKFSDLNESAPMAVGKELVQATYAFDNFLKKDKSAWTRIDNVNGPNMGDLL